MRFLPEDEWTDQRSIARALELAERAAAFASPNPTVGCVLTRDGHLLGEGAHRFEQRDHAEIVALKQARAAGHDLQGASAYVTLEPCSHHGRTGPCADALADAGIARCVIATVDPNPLVRGRGLAKLKAAGIAVDLLPEASPPAQQARRLNDAFAFSIQHGRPFVTLKAALSVDGKLAPPAAARHPGEVFWLTGPAARADVARLRHRHDALLTGIGTVLADDPHLTDRTGLPRRRPLLRVVLDSTLRLPLQSRLVQECAHDLLIVCSAHADAGRLEALRQYPLEIVKAGTSDQAEVLKETLHLLQGRQVRSLLVEGGARINASLLGAALVDRAVLFFADVELGEEATPFATDGTSPYELLQRLKNQTRSAFPHGATEDVRVTGNLHDPWAMV